MLPRASGVMGWMHSTSRAAQEKRKEAWSVCSKSQVWLLLCLTSESILGPGGLERANPFPQGKGDWQVIPREVLL